MSKRKRRSKVNQTGRTENGGKFAMMHRWMVESEAWVELSGDAFKILTVLYLLHNTRNNGSLYLSVREAARRIGCDKDHAHKCFRELVDKGFIKPRRSVRDDMTIRAATAWVLTEFPCDEQRPTKEFMAWRRPETPARQKRAPSPSEGQVVPQRGTAKREKAQTVPQRGTGNARNGPSPVPQQGTQVNMPYGGGGRAAARAAGQPAGRSEANPGVVVAVGPLQPGDNSAGAALATLADALREKPKQSLDGDRLGAVRKRLADRFGGDGWNVLTLMADDEREVWEQAEAAGLLDGVRLDARPVNGTLLR